MSEFHSVEFENSEIRSNKLIKNKNASNAAKELLKNGILVETSKGLICMSLKDALNEGVGGHNLSVEDFQTVAAELLFQQGPDCVNIQEGVSLWTENAIKPNKIYGQLKNNNNTKMKNSKFSLKYSITDSLKNAQENIDEYKDIHEAFLGLPSFEYSLFEKIGEESEESSFDSIKKQLVHFEESIPEQNEVKNKMALSNKRSLILSNDVEKPVITVQKLVKKLSNKNESISQVKFKTTNLSSMLISSNLSLKNSHSLHESYVSCGEMSDNSEVASLLTDETETKPAKKRGGWPKGRKRKPEMKNEVRPPKAPATGYVIFLNERRKEYRDMPFTEVTKLLGNEWSRLSLQEKKVYLDQAEIEKKRYREELKIYRQSDAYQTYLHKKHLKRLQENGTEESDMDATDEIDEEDNEELYCRSCDQWFHSLHNKKEHLYGRQHLQSLAGRFTKLSDRDWRNPSMSSTSLDESSLDGSSYLKDNKEHCCSKIKESLNMDDAIVKFMSINKEREEERVILKKKLDESKSKNQALSLDLQKLNKTLDNLSGLVESERTTQILLEQRLFNLLNVPTLFYLPEALIEENH